jgi:MFS transporter, SP family, ERD6-like sugar transporter
MASDGDHGGALQKPLLPKAPRSGGWFRKGTSTARLGTAAAGTSSKAAALRPPHHVPALLCTLVVALGTVQFGFTSGYSSPAQDGVTRDLDLSISEVPTCTVPPGCSLCAVPGFTIGLKTERANN